MFVDEIEIEVHAGRGGDGCVAFLREKFKPKGGPAGGNGGYGGSVYIEIDIGLLTLQDFRGRRIFKASRGGNGEGKKRKGARGNDCVVRVPPGTSIYDMTSKKFITEVNETTTRFMVAKGGKGGLGNAVFASSIKQTPRKATPGTDGETKKLHLELRMLADIGVVGLPSAGKSSLVALVSSADPKKAEYHFTTLAPKIGHIDLGGFYRIVIADLPGLIEHAHEGKGLGHKFLKHIQRTKMLVHMISWRDEFADDPSEFMHDREIILNEMVKFDDSLLEKPIYTVLNKTDKISPELDSGKILDNLQCHLGDEKLHAISIETHDGVEALIQEISTKVLVDSDKLIEGLPVIFKLDEILY